MCDVVAQRFFCALCAGGALVRGEIGRQPHFLWSAPDGRARGRLFNGNVRSMAVHFVSRGAEIAPNFVKNYFVLLGLRHVFKSSFCCIMFRG